MSNQIRATGADLAKFLEQMTPEKRDRVSAENIKQTGAVSAVPKNRSSLSAEHPQPRTTAQAKSRTLGSDGKSSQAGLRTLRRFEKPPDRVGTVFVLTRMLISSGKAGALCCEPLKAVNRVANAAL